MDVVAFARTPAIGTLRQAREEKNLFKLTYWDVRDVECHQGSERFVRPSCRLWLKSPEEDLMKCDQILFFVHTKACTLYLVKEPIISLLCFHFFSCFDAQKFVSCM